MHWGFPQGSWMWFCSCALVSESAGETPFVDVTVVYCGVAADEFAAKKSPDKGCLGFRGIRTRSEPRWYASPGQRPSVAPHAKVQATVCPSECTYALPCLFWAAALIVPVVSACFSLYITLMYMVQLNVDRGRFDTLLSKACSGTTSHPKAPTLYADFRCWASLCTKCVRPGTWLTEVPRSAPAGLHE